MQVHWGVRWSRWFNARTGGCPRQTFCERVYPLKHEDMWFWALCALIDIGWRHIAPKSWQRCLPHCEGVWTENVKGERHGENADVV